MFNMLLFLVISVVVLSPNNCPAQDEVAENTQHNKATEQQTTKTESNESDYFAIVGSDVISKDDYFAKLQIGVRQRFFHGKVPEKQMQEFRREIGKQLIDRALLLQEAKRRNIQPDEKDVDTKIASLEKKRHNDVYWQNNREKLLPAVRKEFERDGVIDKLQKRVKDVDEPSPEEVRAYFDAHPDKFTIPERLHVSVILLKVDPSSGSAVWQQAIKEAGTLVEKIRKGADFAELARIHSSDESASKGGDMGYIHKGMLAKPAQQIIDLMEPGEISDPVVLLQGVAIFKLDERVKPTLNEFGRVKDTAAGLIKRERAEQAWKKLLADLRANTEIKVNESVY
jgi:parvulin-like peptidyl-prolyl isomerase